MAKIPIKQRPQLEDKQKPKPNREAILRAQELVDTQLMVKDSGDVPRPALQPQPPDTASANNGMPSTWGGETGEYRELKSLEERHEQRMEWFYSEASRQAPNRRLMARCEGMYDGEQWRKEDADTLEARGQKPIVYNEIAPTIDFLIGTERRSRIDFFVIAQEDDDGAADDAINKTKLLKYLADIRRTPFEISEAAEDQFKAGLGILEVGLSNDKGAPVFVGSESWRNFLHDSRARKDQSDARYNFRVKEIDLDIACALFPEHEEELKAVATKGDGIESFRGFHGITGSLAGLDAFSASTKTNDDEFEGVSKPVDWFNSRERVTIIECWSREPVRKPIRQAGLGDPIEFKIRVSLMIETKTLLESWSPFKHDRFPFVLMWAYRNRRTGMPYGPILRLTGPQEGFNQRMARSLFEASFNQMEMEEGAISETMDIEELHAEANDPNGMLVFANGALSGNKVRQRQNPGGAREQVMLAQIEQQSLRQLSNVNEENRGLQSSATSRVAMDAKAERGSVGTAQLFDEQLLARQQVGELELSLCEQFIVQPMTIRVAGESGPGQQERVKLNQPMPDGTYANDITTRKAHFVIGEQAWKQSYAESAFASLMEVLTQLAASTPQIVVALLDVVFDMHPNLPRKKQVLERIRAVNGQTDPDGKMTPEQQAQAQQKAAIAQAQFELQMAQLKADVQGAQAKGEKLSVDAMVARVTALYEAAQAAQVLALAPHLTPIADQILSSAGYIDQQGSPATLPIPAPQAAPPMGQIPPPLQADGAMQGIQTMRPQDGVMQGA